MTFPSASAILWCELGKSFLVKVAVNSVVPHTGIQNDNWLHMKSGQSIKIKEVELEIEIRYYRCYSGSRVVVIESFV